MRKMATFIRRHGGKRAELFRGPEVPAHIQTAEFKSLQRATEHASIEHAELFELVPLKARSLSKPTKKD